VTLNRWRVVHSREWYTTGPLLPLVFSLRRLLLAMPDAPGVL
jgi:hypothetical protein